MIELTKTQYKAYKLFVDATTGVNNKYVKDRYFVVNEFEQNVRYEVSFPIINKLIEKKLLIDAKPKINCYERRLYKAILVNDSEIIITARS